MVGLMEWNNATYRERLVRWKELREDISDKDVTTSLDTVAKFWAKVPYSNSKLNLYDFDSWNSPWELLSKKVLCDNMITLMMYYTIDMALPNVNIDIRIVHLRRENFIVAVIDDKYIMNYDIGKVVDIDDINVNFVYTYTKKDIKGYC